MDTTSFRTAVLASAAAFCFALPATAQWPTNPTQNLPVGDASGEQTVPKFAATSDGGCYAAWFDSRGGSYAVYLQRLDPAGNEMWPHNGLLVSNNPQSSSLVDWDMIADSEDHCVLTFTDTRAGGDLDVYAYRVSPGGVQLWGANGVALSNNADYEANPRVCEASDGAFVFVWPNTVARTLQVQRLDRNGVPQFPGDGVPILGDTGATPAFCKMVPAESGSVILSWVRTMAFSGNKHVHMQKVSAAGTQVWNGGTRLPVFDSNSVPIAHEPRLVADGMGGAFCSWHFAIGQQFYVRVQHVDINGVEVFAHNGINPSNSTGSKFDPSLAWNLATQELFVAWNERNLAQSQWGIFAQKIDATGTPQWTATGTTLIPVNTTEKLTPVATRLGDGLSVSVLETSLGINMHAVRSFGLDNAGNVTWSTNASTFASNKMKLGGVSTASGSTLLGWVDSRSGVYDLYMQALDLAGAVGLQVATVTPYGCGGNPAGSLVTTGRPAFGTTMQIGITNPVGTQAAGSLCALVLGLVPAAGYPCGTPAPGFGMAGPGQPGELLVDLTGPNAAILGAPWAGPGNPSWFAFSTPFAAWVLGLPLHAQGVILDVSPSATVPIGLTTGARIVLGS